MTTATDPLQNVLDRLERVTGGPQQFMAACPAHKDRHASLSVGLGDDGRVLLNCKAGCAFDTVVAALDLRKADLFVLKADAPRRAKRPASKPPTIFETPGAAAAAKARRLKAEHAGSWTYYGADGAEVLTVLRFNLPDGDKTYRPLHRNGDGWSFGDPPGLLPLYRLADLDGARRVYVAEGEKCADAAARLGLVATTSAHGAESAHKTDWRRLAGLDVPILPDSNKGGEDYARDVATILTALDLPARVCLVRLPGLPEGGDIVDWLEAHDGQDAETLRNEIEALADAAPIWTAPVKAKDTADDLVFTGAARCTDSANAQRFVEQAGDDFRYVGAWKKWIRYNGVCWRQDDDLAILKRAKRVVMTIYTECRRETDDVTRANLSKWAAQSLRADRLKAMIDLSRPELAVSPDDLDRDPMLLNCENGTLHLPTGELRPHNRADLITKKARVTFDAKADCPLWRKHLTRIMDGNANMIGYLQRLFGVCTTGDVRDQHLPICYGVGGNGKSATVDTICGLMGDYASQAAPDLLIIKKFQDHPTELADLCGKRLIVSCEAEEGSRLKVQLVKRLTGDARLKGRFMKADFFEFERTFKIILVTNNKPQVREASVAIWRRVALVPFGVVIPPKEQDLLLLGKLRAEFPGILNWLLAGCREWLEHGLQVPDEVKVATETYKAEQDAVAGFVADCCVLDPVASVTRADIYAAYTAWAKRSGEPHPLVNRQLYERLRNLPDVTDDNPKRVKAKEGAIDDDPKQAKSKVTRCFRGIGLAAPSAEDVEEEPEAIQ